MLKSYYSEGYNSDFKWVRALVEKRGKSFQQLHVEGKPLTLATVAMAGPNDKIECLTLNYIWLAWAENLVQERGKSSSSCARRGKPDSLATVVRKYSLPKSM
jgi:hypothetical protein